MRVACVVLVMILKRKMVHESCCESVGVCVTGNWPGCEEVLPPSPTASHPTD